MVFIVYQPFGAAVHQKKLLLQIEEERRLKQGQFISREMMRSQNKRQFGKLRTILSDSWGKKEGL